jgi:hypothetical protein
MEPFADGLPDSLRAIILLLLVAGFWYFIGNWFDRRRAEDLPSKSNGLMSSVVAVFGAVVSLFSFGLARYGHASNFIQTIQIALIQTWAVFLIGIPAVGLVRGWLERRGKIELSDPTSRISNFRLLEIIVGVFAILVLLWLPPGPLLPPQGFRRTVLQLLGR